MSCLTFASAQDDKNHLLTAIDEGLSELHGDVVSGNLTADKVSPSADMADMIKTAIRNRDGTSLLTQLKAGIRNRAFEPSLWHRAPWDQSNNYVTGDYVTYPADVAIDSS
jgi:hypothetical protein